MGGRNDGREEEERGNVKEMKGNVYFFVCVCCMCMQMEQRTETTSASY